MTLSGDEHNGAEAQGQESSYAFHTLGWYQFEKLCRTILCDILGQTVEVHSSGNDAGRDAAFSGAWSATGSEDLVGSFTFQVKYSRRNNIPLTLSVLKNEIGKAKSLAKSGLLDNYIVITNHLTTGARTIELCKTLQRLTNARTVKIYGVEWLTQLIAHSSHLRMLVPRVYGLGDLSEILDQRAYDQARAILSWMPALKTIVTTEAMQHAARVLRTSRFVLLVGDAMVGKTTAASALAIAALDDLKLRILKVRTAAEFAEHWNATRDARQFFWIDDAFGETSFDEGLTRGWGRHLDALSAALEGGACVVMTSRNYIWERARDVIKTYSFEYFRTSQVVIRLEDLTIDERLQMLYNHLRMGDQSISFKQRVQPFLSDVARIQPFYPEAARRFGNSYYTRNIGVESSSLSRFFASPRDILIDIIGRLSGAEKALLALIFANKGRLPAPIVYDDGSRRYINLFGAQPHEVSHVAEPMQGVFISYVLDLDGSMSYRFIHPSLSDAIATMTAERTEWLEIYLAGASTLSVLTETHAGRMQEKGVAIAVPSSHYSAIIERIRVLIEHQGAMGTYWTSYLGSRSGPAFLQYAQQHLPEAFEECHYVEDEWDPRDDDFLKLCSRLNECNRLSDTMKKSAVERIKRYLSYSIEYVEEKDAQPSLLSDDNREEIRQALCSNAGELLKAMRDLYDDNYNRGDDPSAFYSSAFEYIDRLERVCADGDAVSNACAGTRERVSERVHELEDDVEEHKRNGASAGRDFSFARNRVLEPSGIIQRNIFSDVADPD